METGDVIGNGLNESENHSHENTGAAYNHSEGTPLMNGISNGIGDSKQKEKKHRDSDHRDKHKDKHREKDHKHKDKDRDKQRDKDREKNSSSHKSKDGHSSSHSSSRDKDKNREKDRDRDKERDKDGKHKNDKKEKDHKSNSSSSKDKEKEKDREHSHSKHSSSSSKSHSSSKDKEKSSSSSKDKERSSDRDKASDKDKYRSDKEKSKHGSEKSKHSSSSSKDKEKRDKDKEKKSEKHHRSDSDSARDKVKKESLETVKEEEHFEIKEEPYEDQENSSFSQVETTFEDVGIKEELSDDDAPLSARVSVLKREASDEDEDDMPLVLKKKVKKESISKRKKMSDDEEDDEYSEDLKPKKKKTSKKPKVKAESQAPSSQSAEPSPKKKKVKEEEQEVWRWWEEEKKDDGVKWNYLEHKGPVFAPPYEPLPKDVKLLYDGKEIHLSPEAEEVASFYARMIEHDYTSKDVFNNNFFKDWRKTMTSKEKELITDLKKCNFKKMHAYFIKKSEERKAMSKEEKKALKEQNEELIKEYGFCTIDGHKEKIGNFKIEPPSLFRGRGEHPKMGMLKKRVMPEDVLINCSKDSKYPQPPPGHKWKEIRHDNTVTWLASWTENVQGQVKYVMLNPSSKLKGEKDMQKYETARKLAHSIEKIRREYREDWKSKEMRIRQRSVALYFIDKLALRAGNEKDEDQADTVGCCSLRVEHIQLHEEKDGKQYVVVFDFLGKDSIRYYNEVPVEKRVFKNLQLFMEGKNGSDDLFDRLNTLILNKHLNELMEGLTAKVFRTYNASWTLQEQLKELTDPGYSLPEMILAYNRANRAVAILCNHQRSVPKSHQKSMENLKEKIATKKEQIEEAEKQYKFAKKDAKKGSAKEQIVADKKKKALERLKQQLTKLEVQETDKEENKTIALGTSKLNYLDPRISVAWCKKYNVPIDKIYNKTQRDKFRWAIDMAGPDYVF
ncbi:DNA topoisomerase 1 isoform X3 [Rhodnius prolixus]|uniref:DNA topoisomerase 1 isoform X3 n=1 Tax=Rhodnius prolixus TaxID=13249 RepID=UPI003D18D6E7